ncbi:GNAT family N-acetyltransferase [Paracoccus alkanivorans]|uniref:GNAT family N-acetyltransferase n=1 Tax=Paracoccus alkanivorans TaxID=2116655 RepID=A0A3M0MI34_9RHOB|nr:GNAT family N-acetyltransferase [Paracoccus alkanivorans]
MIIRQARRQDADWIARLLTERWGGVTIAAHGEVFDVRSLPALVADPNQGLATYRVRGKEAELMLLDAVYRGRGIGTRLIEALVEFLREQGIFSLWVMTTNDNLTALRFYQRRGFELRQVRAGAVSEARLLKPTIPEIGDHGIPIRDEIDLCRRLI